MITDARQRPGCENHEVFRSKEGNLTVKRIRIQLSIIIVMSVFLGGTAKADTCLAPAKPFVPTDPLDVREYEDLIRQDFETYIIDVQIYFRCVDAERARVFVEAQEVSQEYGRFSTTVLE